MKRHLIIEGMDGSGKDTLIAQLAHTPLGDTHKMHSRASTSIGGPVDDLSRWVAARTKPSYLSGGPWFFNRHPLISELIYADLREVNRGLSGGFTNGPWVATLQQFWAEYAVLVIVQPPYELVEKALTESGSDAHMPGVWSNRKTLYDRYKNFMWPGTVIRYDRTTSSPDDLYTTLTGTLEGIKWPTPRTL